VSVKPNKERGSGSFTGLGLKVTVCLSINKKPYKNTLIFYGYYY
jgi:hypothetical protein